MPCAKKKKGGGREEKEIQNLSSETMPALFHSQSACYFYFGREVKASFDHSEGKCSRLCETELPGTDWERKVRERAERKRSFQK